MNPLLREPLGNGADAAQTCVRRAAVHASGPSAGGAVVVGLGRATVVGAGAVAGTATVEVVPGAGGAGAIGVVVGLVVGLADVGVLEVVAAASRVVAGALVEGSTGSAVVPTVPTEVVAAADGREAARS